MRVTSKPLRMLRCEALALGMLGLAANPVSADMPVIAVNPGPAAPVPPPPSPWSIGIAAGFVNTNGNSQSRTANAKVGLTYAGTLWINQFTAAALYGSKDHITTDERYALGDKLSYNLTPRDYLFGNGSWDSNRFAGVAERYVLTAGYGRHVFATPTQSLDLEGGGGFNRTRNRGEEDFTYRPILTAGGKYVWKISPSAQFTQTLRTELAGNNSYLNPVSELKLKIIGSLSALLDYEIQYNTDVPAGAKHTDTITTFNLAYSFNEKKS